MVCQYAFGEARAVKRVELVATCQPIRLNRQMIRADRRVDTYGVARCQHWTGGRYETTLVEWLDAVLLSRSISDCVAKVCRTSYLGTIGIDDILFDHGPLRWVEASSYWSRHINRCARLGIIYHKLDGKGATVDR